MVETYLPFGTVTLTQKSIELVQDCLSKGRISSGRRVREFEEKYAELIGVKEAVAVSSGTDANTLALAVLHEMGARRGDEVILPALSFVATGNAVLHAGLTPVFVDVERDTLNIDVEKIEAAVTKRTRAIMPVHLMGKPANMDAIREIAARHNLLVVEDAAEAHGARYKGQNVGSLGDMAAFSLYIAHIITTGEGGIVVTDNEIYAEILRSLRSHGRACKCRQCISNISSGYCERRFQDTRKGDIRFYFERIGYSSKMNELEASLGLGTMDLFEEIVRCRRENLFKMIDGFNDFQEYFLTFNEEPHEKIGPHAFPFVLREKVPFGRDDLMRYLEKNGVDARTLFSSMPTQCGGYEFLGYRPGDFPNAEYVGRQGIHIGVHQDICAADIDRFLNCVGDFIARPLRECN